MEQTSDVARGDWLVARAGAWGTIGGVAGTGFEAYARVLHPVPAHREDRTATDQWGDHPVLETTTWRWANVAARTGGTLDPTTRWSLVTGVDDESDVSFPDGWRIGPPDEGRLDPEVLAVLVGHLAAATSTPEDLVAAVWDGWGDLNGSSTMVVAWQSVEGEPSDGGTAGGDAGRRRPTHR